jgi:TetR/AcrR family transcriptional regulator, copper-responsive repressor
MELFWRQGYESTSISDLTSAMGITAPSLYAAFGDKERLYLEAVELYKSGLGNSGRILAAETTARAAIERLLEASAIELTNTKDHPPGCMVVASAINGSPQSAHLQSALRGCRLEAEARIIAKIKRGVRVGELPARTNAAVLGKFYMTVMQGMTIQARDGATQKELLAVARAAMLQWPEFS